MAPPKPTTWFGPFLNKSITEFLYIRCTFLSKTAQFLYISLYIFVLYISIHFLYISCTVSSFQELCSCTSTCSPEPNSDIAACWRNPHFLNMTHSSRRNSLRIKIHTILTYPVGTMICPPGVRIIRLCLLDEVVRPSSIGDCLPHPSPRHTFCEPKLLILVANAQKHILKRPADSFSVGKVSHIFKCTKILVQCTENQVISCTMYSNYVIMYSFFLYTFLFCTLFIFCWNVQEFRLILVQCTEILIKTMCFLYNVQVFSYIFKNVHNLFYTKCTKIMYRYLCTMYKKWTKNVVFSVQCTRIRLNSCTFTCTFHNSGNSCTLLPDLNWVETGNILMLFQDSSIFRRLHL